MEFPSSSTEVENLRRFPGQVQYTLATSDQGLESEGRQLWSSSPDDLDRFSARIHRDMTALESELEREGSQLSASSLLRAPENLDTFQMEVQHNMSTMEKDLEQEGKDPAGTSKDHTAPPPAYTPTTAPEYTQTNDHFPVVITRGAHMKADGTMHAGPLCCTSRSKWFQDPGTQTDGSTTQPYWICARCRQRVRSRKYAFFRLSDIVFYSCDDCWAQIRRAKWCGLLMRISSLNLFFGVNWVSSPPGVFWNSKGAWLGVSIVLYVVALLTVIVSFVNAISIRQLCTLRKKQTRRPLLDCFIELAACIMLGGLLAWLIYQGCKTYPGRKFDGRVIGIMVFACYELTCYSLYFLVAVRIYRRSRSNKPHPAAIGAAEEETLEKQNIYNGLLEAVTYLH